MNGICYACRQLGTSINTMNPYFPKAFTVKCEKTHRNGHLSHVTNF